MGKPDVKLAVVGDASQLQRELNKATGNVETFGSKVKSAARDFVGAFAVAGFFKAGLDELKEAQAVSAQTAAALKSTGGAANVSADEISALAGELSKLSGKDDEAIQSAENLLLTFTKIKNGVGEGNDVFDQATRVTLDLSVAFGKDLNDSAILVGKALQDPIKGVTALRRVGVQLSDQQTEQIRKFVEVGDIMSAQKIILEELNTQVGGSAEAYGKTLPGQIDRAKESFNNLAGGVVGVLAPALEGLATVAVTLFDAFQALPGPVQDLVVYGGLAAAAFKRFGGSFDDLATKAYDMVGALEGSAATIGGLSAGIAGIAAVAVGAAYGISKIAEAAADGDFGTFSENIDRTDLALKELASSGKVIGILSEELPDLAKGFQSTEAGATGFLESALDFGQYLPGITGSVANLGEETDKAFDQKSLDEFNQQVDTLDKRLAELFRQDPSAATAAMSALRSQLILLGVPTEALNGAFDDFEAAQRDAADATVDNTNKVDDQIQAYKDLQDQLKAMFDPVFGFLDALDSNEEAQQKVTAATLVYLDAVKQHGENSLEAAKAQEDLDDAQRGVFKSAVDAEQAQLDLVEAVKNNEVSSDQASAAIDRMTAAGYLSEEQANNLRTQIFLLTLGAQEFDGDYTATLHADVSEPLRLLGEVRQAFINTANLLAGGGVSAAPVRINANPTFGGGNGYATGGMLNEGWNWVGENGPELINKKGSTAQVLSAGESAGGGAGRPAQINVYLDKRVLTRALWDGVKDLEASIR